MGHRLKGGGRAARFARDARPAARAAQTRIRTSVRRHPRAGGHRPPASRRADPLGTGRVGLPLGPPSSTRSGASQRMSRRAPRRAPSRLTARRRCPATALHLSGGPSTRWRTWHAQRAAYAGHAARVPGARGRRDFRMRCRPAQALRPACGPPSYCHGARRVCARVCEFVCVSLATLPFSLESPAVGKGLS